MIALAVLLLSGAQSPGDQQMVYACERYESISETDGVGSYVDMRAVSYDGDRWTFEFVDHEAVEVDFDWLDKGAGLARMQWHEADDHREAVAHFLVGSDEAGLPTFWLSEGSSAELDGPGYICNGRVDGK